MAPDLIPIDPSSDDDARLLAAIERAWPVPPMPPRMKEPVMATTTPISSGNLIAPIAVVSARRSWGVLARIAAVIVLVLAGMSAITHESGPKQSVPIYLQAPSPNADACSIPLRSRAEVTALVEEVLQTTPPDSLALTYPVHSAFEFSEVTNQEAADLKAMLDAQAICLQQGISAVRLTSVSERVAKLGIGYTIGNGTPWDQVSTEETVDKIFAFTPPGIVPEKVAFDRRVVRDLGDHTAVIQDADALLNSWGWWYTNVNGQWITDGYVYILEAWSTLAATVAPNDIPIQGVGCPPGALRSWTESDTLLDQLDQDFHGPPSNRDGMEALMFSNLTSASADATQQVTDVIDAYRQCLQGGETPGEFAWSTDEFFWKHAQRDKDGNLAVPANVQALTSSAQSTIPSTIERVTQLSEGKYVAILTPSSSWAQKRGVHAGILLINQDGQWLIDELVLVKDA